ncbi:hypothetical protein B7494_g1781 [Chlorociboria aeruginascens]|nr:hypothetical protein B7494_g1781 [Chlorociboria aeruginascens]
MLINDIAEKYILGTFDNSQTQFFLPEGQIRELITEPSLREAVPELPDDIIKWILKNSHKLFATTLKSLQSDTTLLLPALKRFKDARFEDSCMPIPIGPRANDEDNESPTSDTDAWERAFDPEVWGRQHRISFFQDQWIFFAPVFQTSQYLYDLCAEHILPVIWKHQLSHEGGFAAVHKVEMHKAHRRLSPKSGGEPYKMLAIKAILLGNMTDSTDEIWEKEAKALSDTNTIEDKHIIKCLAAVRRGDNRYFMFPWADGGTLRDYWNESQQHSRRPNVIKEAVEQLYGLSGALMKLHEFKDEPVPSSLESSTHLLTIQEPDSERDVVTVQGPHEEGDSVTVPKQGDEGSGGLRHGDLKPENILRFIEDETDDDSELCTLKIADMGLAKRHVLATRERNGATTTIYATRQYEPPERGKAEPLSRLYDVWSMGCIILDYIVWILYGNNELNRFNKEIQTGNIPRYFHIPEGEHADQAEAIISQGVERWMEFIRTRDPECRKKSAIRDLLDLVKTKLLVPSKSTGLGRVKASELHEELGKILAKIKNDNHAYVLTATNLDIIEKVPPPGNHLTSGTAIDSDNFDDKWYLPIDNIFARQHKVMCLIKRLTPSASLAQLCNRCQHLSFWTADFSLVEDKASKFKGKKNCQFCQLIWGICQNNGVEENAKLVFWRDKSVLKMEGGPPTRGNRPPSLVMQDKSDILQGRAPVLSLLRDRALKLDSIQIGLPQLPDLTNSPFSTPKEFFELICLWLQDCDENHPGCRRESRTRLPTRLIHIGKSNTDKVVLYETTGEDQRQYRKGSDKYSYVALSHRWGDPRKCKHFVTLPGKVLDEFKEEIPSSGEFGLPPTFQHAIEVARWLGKEYLWIDSICILQGLHGDFKSEAKVMEDVFSSAYCVIAASRAEDQRDGFLKPREKRKFLKFETSAGNPFYACEPIDDFKRDVLDGPLNRRGWVLQERALARRTIYFTQVQTYFECGEGVRCETLSKIRQTQTEFLGDPSFPQKIKNKTRGIKIRDFTGLRLGSAYDAQVRFGIFDDGPDKGFFHRSLLWRRGDNEPMVPIPWPKDRFIHVPTWSWMGRTGVIDYFNLDGNQFDWEKDDIHPPWTGNEANVQPDVVDLEATVRQFDLGSPRNPQNSITFDMQVGNVQSKGECVIVARTKYGGANKKNYYILVVSASGKTATTGEPIYQRIGVGHITYSCILWNHPKISVRIS